MEASELSILEETSGCFFLCRILCRKGFTMVQTADLMIYVRINRANGDDGANGANRANEANQPSGVNWAN